LALKAEAVPAVLELASFTRKTPPQAAEVMSDVARHIETPRSLRTMKEKWLVIANIVLAIILQLIKL
jgi:hypothetical protein